jgi:hypothetical protein
VEDRNFPVGRDDITDGAVGKDALGDVNGNDIAGEGLRWDTTENLRVNEGDGLDIAVDGTLQVNNGFGLDINDAGEVDVDPSEFNGAGLDYDPVTRLLSVDLGEIALGDYVDNTTIGYDNPKAYVAGKTYEIDEKCSDGGINYNSLADANTGNTPATSPTWWVSIGSQNVLKIKEGLPGDGLQWSTNGHLEVKQGVGLDINAVTGALDVDPSEFNGNGLDVTAGLLVVDLSEIANPVLAEATVNSLTASMPVKTNASKLLVSGAIVLTTDVSGVLPAANGGRGSRMDSTTSRATLTPNFDNYDMHILSAQAEALNIANSGGTAIDGFKLIIRIKDNATARAITYGTQYRGIIVALPSTTVLSKTLYLGFIWNVTDTKYDLVAIAQEA